MPSNKGPVSDEERDEIRPLHNLGKGRSEIAKQLGRGGRTISNQAERMGLSFDRAAEVRGATEVCQADLAALRSELALALTHDAMKLREQMWQRTQVHNFGGKDNTFESRTPRGAGRREARTDGTLGMAVDRSLKLSPPEHDVEGPGRGRRMAEGDDGRQLRGGRVRCPRRARACAHRPGSPPNTSCVQWASWRARTRRRPDGSARPGPDPRSRPSGPWAPPATKLLGQLPLPLHTWAVPALVLVRASCVHELGEQQVRLLADHSQRHDLDDRLPRRRHLQLQPPSPDASGGHPRRPRGTLRSGQNRPRLLRDLIGEAHARHPGPADRHAG